MRIGSSILVVVKIAAISVVAGCGGGGAGKIMADTTILPYQAPDIDELSGTESDSDSDSSEGSGSGSGSAQNPQK